MPPKDKRRYLVLKRRRRADLPDIWGRKFGTHNAFTVSDRKVAEDIDQKYGRGSSRADPDRESVVVIPVADRRAQRQDGYRVQFSVPELPWQKGATNAQTKGRRRARPAKGR